jgi:hypothetical protein
MVNIFSKIRGRFRGLSGAFQNKPTIAFLVRDIFFPKQTKKKKEKEHVQSRFGPLCSLSQKYTTQST